MKGAIISVLVTILILNIGLSLGLKCFECTKIGVPADDPGCDKSTITPAAKECKQDGTGVVPMCRRTTAKIKVAGQDFNMTVRGCFAGTKESSQACVDLALPEPFSVTAKYCTCNTDNCNGKDDPYENNPAPNIRLAHFTLPLIGIAVCQALALL